MMLILAAEAGDANWMIILIYYACFWLWTSLPQNSSYETFLLNKYI